jgi:hypothetical protein
MGEASKKTSGPQSASAKKVRALKPAPGKAGTVRGGSSLQPAPVPHGVKWTGPTFDAARS